MNPNRIDSACHFEIGQTFEFIQKNQGINSLVTYFFYSMLDRLVKYLILHSLIRSVVMVLF
ncbi:unnamed protein product [Brassica oleracea var. botrytis]